MTYHWSSINEFEETVNKPFENFDFDSFLRTSYSVTVNKYSIKKIEFVIYSNKAEYRILYENGLNVPALTDNVFSVEDIYYGVMTRLLTEERNFMIKNNIK
jgi:hypothetical protein